MRKSLDSLQQYKALRDALLKERATLRARLQQIESALGDAPAAEAAPTPAAAPAAAPARRGRPPGSGKRGPKPAQERKGPGRPSGRKPGRPPRNGISIRDAIAQVTSKQPLTVREIVDAVQKIGYKFSSSNPVNSVGAYLYGSHGKKHFKRADGKFGPV
jgi:hypothetical protein